MLQIGLAVGNQLEYILCLSPMGKTDILHIYLVDNMLRKVLLFIFPWIEKTVSTKFLPPEMSSFFFVVSQNGDECQVSLFSVKEMANISKVKIALNKVKKMEHTL